MKKVTPYLYTQQNKNEDLHVTYLVSFCWTYTSRTFLKSFHRTIKLRKVLLELYWFLLVKLRARALQTQRSRLAIALRDRRSQKAWPSDVINADFQGGPIPPIGDRERSLTPICRDCMDLRAVIAAIITAVIYRGLRAANYSLGRISLNRRLP